MHTFQPEKQSWSSLWSSMASWIDDCCVSISMVCTLVVDMIGLYCLNVAACYNTLHKHWFYAGSYRQWLCCFSLVYWKDIPTWLAVPTSAVAGVFLSMETYYHLQMPHQQTVWVRANPWVHVYEMNSCAELPFMHWQWWLHAGNLSLCLWCKHPTGIKWGCFRHSPLGGVHSAGSHIFEVVKIHKENQVWIS